MWGYRIANLIFSAGSSFPVIRQSNAGICSNRIVLTQLAYCSTLKLSFSSLEKLKMQIKTLDTSIDKSIYTLDLTKDLTAIDESYLSDIVFCPNILRHAQRYLGAKPCLSGFQIYANISSSLPIEGSKLWHRDSDVSTAAEYYVNLTEVQAVNGPLYVCCAPSSNRLFYPRPAPGSGWADNDRYTDKDIRVLFGDCYDNFVFTNIGPIGKVTFIDSGLHFHKGGHTINGSRIVLRIIYESSALIAHYKLKNKKTITSSSILFSLSAKAGLFSNLRSSLFLQITNLLLKLRHYKEIDYNGIFKALLR